jgi:beta-glucanase (GH16 family)
VCGWGNNEAQYYTTDSKNVRVENGNLIIEAHQDSLGGKAYTSTRIVSKQKGDWRYGRIEVRAKLHERQRHLAGHLDAFNRLEIWWLAGQWRD